MKNSIISLLVLAAAVGGVQVYRNTATATITPKPTLAFYDYSSFKDSGFKITPEIRSQAKAICTNLSWRDCATSFYNQTAWNPAHELALEEILSNQNKTLGDADIKEMRKNILTYGYESLDYETASTVE